MLKATRALVSGFSVIMVPMASRGLALGYFGSYPEHDQLPESQKFTDGGAFMKTENISRMGNQVRENMTDIAEKARDLSAKVKERLDETYDDLGRTVRRARAAAEDKLDDARNTVRQRPLTSVATVAAGAFAVGLLAGWLLGRQTRD